MNHDMLLDSLTRLGYNVVEISGAFMITDRLIEVERPGDTKKLAIYKDDEKWGYMHHERDELFIDMERDPQYDTFEAVCDAVWRNVL